MTRHYCYLLTRTLPEGGCRYYVGIRTCPVGKTPDTDTSYLGSGKAILAAVKKHGRAEFTKTIVETFETRAEARAMERALVGLPTANSPWSYNLMEGGEDRGLHSEESKARIKSSRRAQQSDESYRKRHRDAVRSSVRTETWKANYRRGLSEMDRAAWLESVLLANRSDQRRERLSRAGLRVWKDNNARREEHARRIKGLSQRPDVANKISKARRRTMEDPKARDRTAKGVARYWATMTSEERSAESKRRWEVRRTNKGKR